MHFGAIVRRFGPDPAPRIGSLSSYVREQHLGTDLRTARLNALKSSGDVVARVKVGRGNELGKSVFVSFSVRRVENFLDHM